MREDYYNQNEERSFHSLSTAISKRKQIDFAKHPPASKPNQMGVSVISDVSISDVIPYIDWGPFFQTWELRGRYPNRGYPKIFDDANVGEEARKLFNDGQTLLNKIVGDKSLYLKGVSGIFKANRSENGEDIDIFTGNTETPDETFCMLRQQTDANTTCKSLSDFIAPKGYDDHLGMFAVSVFGCEQLVSKYELENDDYSKIMVLALADRLVEAFAEYLHMKIRTQMWGYASDECLDTTDLLKIKYDGIRPAPGYPTQPDHTEKDTMWRLLDAERLSGIKLSETKSMIPASSVSALVFAHKECEYFGVGQIDNEQVVNYAQRKRMDVSTVEKWLGSILNY